MRIVMALSCLLVLASSGLADAIVRTRAMSASTIAEIHVEENGVRVELEIGAGDLKTFANLLPDEIYSRLELGSEPFAERQLKLFGEDFRILVGDGIALSGEIRVVRARPRTRRDEVSGEPLPAQGEPEIVVFAELFYPFTERPERITFAPFGGGRGLATVGFVVYHQGVAVNDFRYLTPGYVLSLDWDDPWYSAFERSVLRRTYWAPMSGFLYVEPFEVRKEIILRPMDLQRWVDLGVGDGDVIAAGDQQELLRRVAEFLRTRQKVLIDGAAVTPELARVNFLRRTLTSSTVVDPPEDLPLRVATIGAIFVYPTDGLPEQVTMDWDLFDEKVTQVPCAAVDQAGPMPSLLSPEDPVLTWTNFLKQPYLPSLKVIDPPPGQFTQLLSRGRNLFRGVFVAIGILIVILLVRRRLKLRAAIILPLLLAGALALEVVSDSGLNERESRDLVGGLLENVYKSFDFRDEQRVYDFLEKSVTGELLDGIYLETRKSLELESQGGARTKVKSVELGVLSAAAQGEKGILAVASWTVTGSVGHWGHVHQRRNRYKAALTIAPVDGEWKLADVEIIEEERL